MSSLISESLANEVMCFSYFYFTFFIWIYFVPIWFYGNNVFRIFWWIETLKKVNHLLHYKCFLLSLLIYLNHHWWIEVLIYFKNSNTKSIKQLNLFPTSIIIDFLVVVLAPGVNGPLSWYWNAMILIGLLGCLSEMTGIDLSSGPAELMLMLTVHWLL